MKKITSLVLATVLATTLMASCASGDTDTDPEVLSGGGTQVSENGAGEEDTSEDTYHLVYRDVNLAPGDPSDPAISALGDDYSYFESPSCAYQGIDKVYTFDSVIIRTVAQDDEEFITSIEIKDDTVETPEGIYIGCTRDQVTKAYGEAEGDTLIYEDGTVSVAFIMGSDDTVTDMSYDLISE